MASRRGLLFSFLTTVTLTLSVFGCGKLGSKSEAPKILSQSQGNACLDTLADRFNRYFNGKIEESEWRSSFDCVENQVTFFTKYVRGAVPNGYDQNDIDSMVRKFLITDPKLSTLFVPAIFEFKTSLFGGTPDVFSQAELGQIIKFTQFMREETVALLPVMKARAIEPSEENTLRFTDAVMTLGEDVGRYFSSRSSANYSIPKESFVPFAREIVRLSGGNPTLVDQYSDVARALKVIISGGQNDRIETQSWMKIFQEGASLGSLILAWNDMNLKLSFLHPADKDQFQLKLVDRLEKVLGDVLDLNGGGIHFDQIDPVVDAFPNDDLNQEKRDALKTDLRPLISRFLKGGDPSQITPKAVQTALGLLRNGIKSQIILERMFEHLPESISPKEFEIAAEDYKSRIQISDPDDLAEEQGRVDDLVLVNKMFMGLYPTDSSEFIFSDAIRTSRNYNHLNKMQWYKKIIHHAFSVYATYKPVDGKGDLQAVSKDLEVLNSDIFEILKAWKMIKKVIDIKSIAEKRFREANLFMPISNGDKLVNEAEATYYIAYLTAAGSMASRVWDHIIDHHLCTPGTGMVDEVGNPAVDPACFRKVYFGNVDLYWKSFPDLIRVYKSLSAKQQSQIALSMETAARTDGVSSLPFGPYDMTSMAALPYYAESMMNRFDVNRDQVLDKNEVLNFAFPVFQDTLATLAGRSQKWLLEGALTFALRFGALPKSKIDDAKFLAWCAWRPFWRVRGDRPALYKVLAILSGPMPSFGGHHLTSSPHLLSDISDEALDQSSYAAQAQEE